MSPIVITDVAAAPMLRIDDTGLPTSISRARMRPRIGARIVAFASSSSARSTDACACATLADASETGKHLNDAGREAGLLDELAQVEDRQGCVLGRLDDDRVTTAGR